MSAVERARPKRAVRSVANEMGWSLMFKQILLEFLQEKNESIFEPAIDRNVSVPENYISGI